MAEKKVAEGSIQLDYEIYENDGLYDWWIPAYSDGQRQFYSREEAEIDMKNRLGLDVVTPNRQDGGRVPTAVEEMAEHLGIPLLPWQVAVAEAMRGGEPVVRSIAGGMPAVRRVARAVADQQNGGDLG